MIDDGHISQSCRAVLGAISMNQQYHWMRPGTFRQDQIAFQSVAILLEYKTDLPVTVNFEIIQEDQESYAANNKGG